MIHVITHCFHAYTCRIYRSVFRTCIGTLETIGSLSNTSASYSLSVRQISALLSASFRPLVTKTPLPSRYFLPHVELNQWTCTTSRAPCRAHNRKASSFSTDAFLSNGIPAGTRTRNYSLGGYRDILFHHGNIIF